MLELGLGLWQGVYRGIERPWLRWYDAERNWIPTDAEAAKARAEQAESLLEAERQKAEQQRQRADRLAEQLRTLGITLDETLS